MQFEQTMELCGGSHTVLGDEDALVLKIRTDGSPVWTSPPSGSQRDIPIRVYRQPETPHRLFFVGYFLGTNTYANSTIRHIQNGDGMLVSGMDTTFTVNEHSTRPAPVYALEAAPCSATAIGLSICFGTKVPPPLRGPSNAMANAL